MGGRRLSGVGGAKSSAHCQEHNGPLAGLLEFGMGTGVAVTPPEFALKLRDAFETEYVSPGLQA